jgi:DNA-binding transcriptional regulator YhcF (GntR family)
MSFRQIEKEIKSKSIKNKLDEKKALPSIRPHLSAKTIRRDYLQSLANSDNDFGNVMNAELAKEDRTKAYSEALKKTNELSSLYENKIINELDNKINSVLPPIGSALAPIGSPPIGSALPPIRKGGKKKTKKQRKSQKRRNKKS